MRLYQTPHPLSHQKCQSFKNVYIQNLKRSFSSSSLIYLSEQMQKQPDLYPKDLIPPHVATDLELSKLNPTIEAEKYYPFVQECELNLEKGQSNTVPIRSYQSNIHNG